jgi:ATP-dependent DNA ligase
MDRADGGHAHPGAVHGTRLELRRKIDGIRLLAFKSDREVSLLSRTRRAQDLPSIAEAIASLPVRDVILDGEVSWDGASYHVFDVVWLDGSDRRSLALEERRRLLDGLPLRRRCTESSIEDEQPWSELRAKGGRA